MIALLLDDTPAPAGSPASDPEVSVAERTDSPLPPLREGNTNAAMDEDVFVFPVTAGQRRFWLLDQLVQGGNPALNMPLAVRLRGPLNRQALERAFDEILRRHEVLRTTFHCEKGQLLQVIAPKLTMSIPLVDVQDFPETERAKVPTHLMAEEARQVFDLARGPLLRARLVRLSAAEHLLLFPIHHIVTDGWSNGVLLRELGVLYTAFSQGRPSPLPELPIQFADFAQWQQEGVANGELEKHLDYWRGQLAGELPVLDLPLDRPRQPWRNQVAPGDARTHRLPGVLTEKIKALAVREGASPFMVYLTAFTVLLNRYVRGQEDVLVSTPSANRNRPEVENLIGPFVNPLLLRFDLRGGPTFRALLARTRQVVLGAYEHADAPFETLVEELQPRRLQVNFLYQNVFLQPAQLPDLTVEPLDFAIGGAIFEWTFMVLEDADGIRLELEYQTDLFDAATIDRVLATYERLLTAIAAEGGLETPAGSLPLVSAEEAETAATVLRAERWRLPDASADWVKVCADPGANEAGQMRAGVGLRVLDGGQQPLPVGVPGEIQVEGLAGKEFFRTGDLGRRLADGSVEWLGPMSRVCKINGLRADLRAMEEALRAHPHLREVAVLWRGGEGEPCRPIAYFVSDGVPAAVVSPEQLRAFLREKLPDEMIPAAFVSLPRFPLTADGRLDEGALPEPPTLATGRTSDEGYQAPYLPIHHQIIEIWQELLGTRSVGVRDDFFGLGGNSLLAMRMLYRIEQDFGKTILPATLFKHATVEHLADEILRYGDTDVSPDLVKVQENGTKTPIFFLHGDIAGGGFYCRKLSRVLGDDQPFYALPPMDIVRPLEDRPGIADMAAAHLAVIRSVRPHGPYVLGGFCLGGLVAYEVACRLEAEGETVERLLVIDAWPRNRRLRALRWMAERVGKWRGLDTSHHLYLFCHWHYWTVHWDRVRAMSLRERLAMVGRRLRRKPQLHIAAPSATTVPENVAFSPSIWFDPVQDIPALFMWAAGGYRAKAYHGPTTLLMSSDLLRAATGGDPVKEWSRYVSQLETAELTGNHLECITAHVEELASTIRHCLERRTA